MSGWTDRQREDALERDLTQSILVAYRVPDAPLTHNDRCDSCGAQAQVRMHWPPTEEHPLRKGALEFCGHHYRAHLPELLGDGWAVAVKTEWLTHEDEAP
jgi:hypothetical protein